MTITIFRSTDYSAPALTGQVGGLISVLDGCLANGYGVTPSLGWSKAYSTLNNAAYRQPLGTNQFYLGIDDTNAQNSRLRLYEVCMSAGVAVANGYGATPTDSQVSGGLYAYKSTTADATARPWVLFTNGKIIYLFWQYSGLTTTLQGLYFGDFTSYKYGDAYNTLLVSNVAASAIDASIRCGLVSSTFATTDAGWCCPRAYHQLGGAVSLSRCTDTFRSFNASQLGSAGPIFPEPISGGLNVAPVWIGEGNNGVRGHLPGLWAPMHSRPFTNGDTCSGTGNLVGKTFEAVNVMNAGQVLIETSDTWS